MIDWGDVLFKQLLLVLTSSQYLVSIISLYFVSKDSSILIHFSGVVYSMWSLMCDFFHLASCFQGPSVLQLVSAVHQYFMQFHSWVIVHCIYNMLGFPVVQTIKTLPTVQEIQVQSWGWGDPREKGVAPHSRILPWKIPRTEEPHRIFFCFLAFEKSASRIYVHMFLSELLFPVLLGLYLGV